MASQYKKKATGFLQNLVILSSSVILLQACSSAKKVPYFQDVPDSVKTSFTVKEHTFVEPVIQVNDLLFVTVQTVENKGAGNEMNNNAPANEKSNSYIVDKNGMIEVPLVGRINLLGQTTTQAKETIRQKAANYFVEPIVNVRFLNSYFNIVGDVARPGKYTIIDEKTSILDAIAIAGDLNITGNRNNIMLIRDENGEKRFIRFDFNSTDIFSSPYYFLRSGDVIYVEPLKGKARVGTSDMSKDRILGISATVISLAATVFIIYASQQNNK